MTSARCAPADFRVEHWDAISLELREWSGLNRDLVPA
jgi:hypothetical protein